MDARFRLEVACWHRGAARPTYHLVENRHGEAYPILADDLGVSDDDSLYSASVCCDLVPGKISCSRYLYRTPTEALRDAACAALELYLKEVSYSLIQQPAHAFSDK
jgi:hypothetical protein